jgi:glycosyltransferase involved in cell wall biosynthesis
VAVIHNGLRPEEFDPVVPAADARDILFLGEMRELKGIDLLLQAIADLSADDQAGPTAVLVGGGHERGRFEELARTLGVADQVQFNEPMPARRAFTLGRTIAVPSRAESLPYVILEAIAGGLPIVATRVGGIPEIFGPRSGELVPPADADALAAALRRLLADPERARLEAAERRAYIEPRFSIAGMAAQTEALYHRILLDKSGSGAPVKHTS